MSARPREYLRRHCQPEPQPLSSPSRHAGDGERRAAHGRIRGVAGGSGVGARPRAAADRRRAESRRRPAGRVRGDAASRRRHDRDHPFRGRRLTMNDPFVLAGREYRSRLIVGTGKYKSFPETRRAADAAGAEIVTVAVRRVNITDPGKENLLDHLPSDRFTILPNTAGCYTAEDAIRTCRLAREAGDWTLVKL